MATAKKKKKKAAARGPLVAAGGVVLRGAGKPLIAVVQMRRQKSWVLPKGKLRKNESILEAAKREAIEETGRDVTVHEYLGQIGYVSGGRPKVVKFWRMEAQGKPKALMDDVERVVWLPLDKAISKLSRPREKDFLRKVGPNVLPPEPQGEARRKPQYKTQKSWLAALLNRLGWK